MAVRIVAIDNDEGSRLLLTACLRADDWQMVTLSYLHTTFSMLEQPRPDLIILNFNQADGGVAWSLLQSLKMSYTTATIPLLITTTAFNLSPEVRDYLISRHISVLHKPLNIAFFVSHVKKLVVMAEPPNLLFSNDHRLPILLVEDNEDLSDILTTVLKLEGYKVVSVGNGQEALDSVSRTDYCLILLDIAMPVMNGFEFLAAYSQQKRPHSPVIILSVRTDLDQHSLPPFVVNILSNPHDIHQVLAHVKLYAQAM